jgi:SecD/SecF fusion protein
LIPILALLLFGGSTLQDFAFALLIGVASGAYSSIFIASPVLTHWKERESGFRHRRERIETEHGLVPAYAAGAAAADLEPTSRTPRRAGRITTPEPDSVSAAEFEQMKRDLGVEQERPGRHTSTLTRRLAHTQEDAPARPAAEKPASRTRPAPEKPASRSRPAPKSPAPQGPAPAGDAGNGAEGPVTPAPDIAENDGMVAPSGPKRPAKSRSRNRRHGRPR